MDSLFNATGASVTLESVLCTEQLKRRPSRPPDYQAENQALLALAQELTNSPASVLQRLVDIALQLCRGHSAGISLLEEEGPPGGLNPAGNHFRWHAVAGQWAPLVWNTTTPRDHGPCGTVLDRNTTLLFSNAHRYYAQFAGVQPFLVEGLLVPFHVNGQAVGTVWVIAHDETRKFDAEDQRLLESLATFAATAYQVRLSIAALAQTNKTREAEMADHKLAEHASNLLAAVVESSEDAIVSKTLDGIITSWNAGAERLFGYSPAEAVGQPITIIIPPERHGEEHTIQQRLRLGERIEHFETVRISKTGRPIDISLAISPVRDKTGQIVGASKIARDITERKRAEEALKEADRRKSEFLAMLAHELRNPLAPIRNAVEILRQAGADEQNVKPAAEVMRRQVGQMVRLIDDLLDVSRISQGKIVLRREPTELASVVNHAVETLRPLCESMDHELTVTLPPEPTYLNADPARLTQVVGNLLNNACKFTERGGRIRLSVEREDQQAVIRVQDTGIGIDAEQLLRIFEMFTQVDTSLERSRDGLGIGLTLVKNLVEMHGGTVAAHSTGVGQGSEFVVRLPVLAEPPPRRPQEPSGVKHVATQQRRILVVDDNRDSADSLARLLKLIGHETHTAHDGLEAVEAAAKLEPDVILLDIGLPRLNGYEAARRIREQPRGRDLTLVALTGWGQEEDRRRSEEAGFDAHLVKPVDLDALSKLLVKSSTG